jgi:hypothetical protein
MKNTITRRDEIVDYVVSMLPTNTGTAVAELVKNYMHERLTILQIETIEEFCKQKDICRVSPKHAGYNCLSDHK